MAGVDLVATEGAKLKPARSHSRKSDGVRTGSGERSTTESTAFFSFLLLKRGRFSCFLGKAVALPGAAACLRRGEGRRGTGAGAGAAPREREPLCPPLPWSSHGPALPPQCRSAASSPFSLARFVIAWRRPPLSPLPGAARPSGGAQTYFMAAGGPGRKKRRGGGGEQVKGQMEGNYG